MIQLAIAALVIIVALLLHVTKTEWLILVLTIVAVLSAEAMNTSVEKICDRFFREDDMQVKIIKDSAAGAVLIISIAAAFIGMMVFLPYLRELLMQGEFVK